MGPGGCPELVALLLVSRLPRALKQPSQIPRISRRARTPFTNSPFLRLYFAIGRREPPTVSSLLTPVPSLPPESGFSSSATHLCQWSSSALASCMP